MICFRFGTFENCFRLLADFSDVLCQTRFITSGSVPMNKSFVDGFVDQRHGRIEQFAALLLIGTCNGGTQLFDLRAQLAAVAPVYLVSLCVLSDAFFG